MKFALLLLVATLAGCTAMQGVNVGASIPIGGVNVGVNKTVGDGTPPAPPPAPPAPEVEVEGEDKGEDGEETDRSGA